jgi:hypothetical protein
MLTKSAAPRAATAPGREDIIEGNSSIIPLSVKDLPPAIIKRLHSAGIRNCNDWSALSHRQKRGIWGVTNRSVELIDAAIVGVSDTNVQALTE